MKKNKITLTLSLIFLVIFLTIAFTLNTTTLNNIDSSANIFFANQNNHIKDLSIILGTILKPEWIIIASIIISIALYLKSEERKAKFLIITTLITGTLIQLSKEIFQRQRPINALFSDAGFSFPSGHSTISIVLFGSLIFFSIKYLKNKAQKTLVITASILMILLIGFTRLYLNVHWLSDVIGGYLLGAIILMILIYLYNKN